jgi:hypothetical protein
MKKKQVFFICLTSMFCLWGCYDIVTNHQLVITNKSLKKISVLYSNDLNTEKNENNIAFYLSNQSVILPDSSRDIIRLGGSNEWHDYINAGKTKKLTIYIFDVDSLNRYNGIYSMNNLVTQHKYLMVSSYTEKELEKVKWNIMFR